MAIPKKVLKLVQERDPHCYHCGATEDLVPHHRINRGMGGSKLLDTPDNLMMVCARYNGAMESDLDVARAARAWGHKLAVWDRTERAVFDVAGGWWFLLPDGNRVRMQSTEKF
jgi:5-methylcytosine-specific restriction endonuclease McrA